VQSAISGFIPGIIVLVVAGAVCAESPPASRLPSPELLSIEWVGSPNCRPAQDVFEGLRRLVGVDPNKLLTQKFVVRANVQQLSDGWTLALSSKGPNGPIERQLTVPSCSEVAQAAALVISLWVQPTDESESRGARDEPGAFRQLTAVEAGQLGLASGGDQESSTRSGVRLRREYFQAGHGRHFRMHWALGVTAVAGALPAWSWGLTGRVGVILGAWHVDGLWLWLGSQQRWTITGSAQPLGGEFGLLASGMRLAYALPVTAFLNVQPGIWSLLGRLHGEGLGTLAQFTPSNDGWGAAGLGLDASLSAGRFSLAIGGGNGLPFGRPRFFVGDTLLYQTPAITWFGSFVGAVACP
jgi:hypothetical protein